MYMLFRATICYPNLTENFKINKKETLQTEDKNNNDLQ